MRRTVLAIALSTLTVAGLCLVPSGSQAAPMTVPSRSPIAAYALLVPDSVSESGLIARVVLPGGVGCPRLEVTVTGKRGARQVYRPMQQRSTGPTTLNAFSSLLVCEARIPKGALAASVAGRSIPSAKPRNVDAIALLGDSGCRLKGAAFQACNDPAEWPLAAVSRRVAVDQPDVVVYLGDFFYRESACPMSAEALCGGSPDPLPGAPFTDSGWGWIADALVPMAPLLSAAPLVVVRGNHELCSRGGNGYFLLFDPTFGTGAQCAPASDGIAPTVFSPTRAVDLAIKGGRSLRLVNVDSANGSDTSIDDSLAIVQRPLFERAARFAKRADESWLLTHRPISSIVSTEYLPVPPGEATPWTSVTQAYSSYGLLGDFDLLLSSHIHVAQAVQIPGQPGQIVLGNAGTALDPSTGYAIPKYGPLSNASGQTLVPLPPLPPYPPIPTARYLETWVQFGYAVASPSTSGWSIAMRDVAGQTFATCTAADHEVSCSR